jgi:hypothetical protein
MSTITVNLGVQVSGGPPISIAPHKIEGVESFQQIELSLKRNEKNEKATAQSVTIEKNPIFLSISSDWFDKKGDEKNNWYLKYKIGEGEAIILNAPHLYLRENVLVLDKGWSSSPKVVTVTLQGPGIPEGTSAEDLKKLREKIKEAIATVNIFVGYDLGEPFEPV